MMIVIVIIVTIIVDHQAAGTLKPLELGNLLEATKVQPTQLSFPGKIVARRDGSEFFVTDTNHNRIVSFTPSGEIKRVIGQGVDGGQDGGFETARFKQPQGLALDEDADVLYVADTENHLIRKVDLKTKKVTTIAGTNNTLNSPWDLWIKDQWLYIAMAGPHQIWLMDLSDGSVHLFDETVSLARTETRDVG